MKTILAYDIIGPDGEPSQGLVEVFHQDGLTSMKQIIRVLGMIKKSGGVWLDFHMANYVKSVEMAKAKYPVLKDMEFFLSNTRQDNDGTWDTLYSSISATMGSQGKPNTGVSVDIYLDIDQCPDTPVVTSVNLGMVRVSDDDARLVDMLRAWKMEMRLEAL